MLRAPRSSRRGVLLLVVLSLLVLFMLIGTAFLMSSNQYGRASKASAKLNRVGNYPTKLLDRAVMQIIRDTDNPNSVVRTHSLLRDLYGTDGFVAVVYSPPPSVVFNPNATAAPAAQVSRFAAATAGTVDDQLGPTKGQMIDIYVRALAYDPKGVGGNFSANDPLTPENEAQTVVSPDARHVVKLDRDGSGQLQLHAVWTTDPTNGKQFLAPPLTRGFYNGCLLTITSGPAAGQSTRILDYEFVSTMNPFVGGSPSITSRLFRFRVMTFPRSDGLPLQINPDRPPEIIDLAGATFIVNGRPFNGTGGGYNPFSVAGAPRLTAVETVRLGTLDPVYPEIALTPNAAVAILSDPVPSDIDSVDVFGARYFDNSVSPPYPPLNPKVPVSATPAQRAEILANWKYKSFVGDGGADESYDAADFQNMFLALQTVTPRSQGRVVQPDDGNNTDRDSLPDVLEIGNPRVVDSSTGRFVNTDDFLRLDLEDLPLPSFHRPGLINYWYHRLINYAANPSGGAALPRDAHVLAVLQPYGPDGIREGSPGDSGDDPTVISLGVRDQLVAIKRKFILRPLREDHPNFDGSNPLSRPMDLSSIAPLLINGNISIPYWEAVGPWDVDNDNDGVPDSIWVDLGEPVAQAEDGTLYKPMFALLIVDLDSRLNVNAHGLVDEIVHSSLAAIRVPDPVNPGNYIYVPGPNLTNDLSSTTDLDNTNWLPHGLGYGPAEISLRPLFRLVDRDDAGNRVFNAVDRDGDGDLDAVDNYATLLVGRATGDGRFITGRYGLDRDPSDDFPFTPPTNTTPFRYEVDAGITSTSPTLVAALGTVGPPDIHSQLKFFGYPEFIYNYAPTSLVPSVFGTAPDLMGRYALGLDYAGQPVYEYFGEMTNRPLVADSPYELDLSGDRRRDTRADSLSLRLRVDPTSGMTETQYVDASGAFTSTPGVAADNDDAPFAAADLERILRSYDADAGILPDRLWNVVDALDPVKLVRNQPLAVETFAQQMFNDTSLRASDPNDAPQMLAAAQMMAGPARRLVTTDSYDLPVPGGSFLSRLICGADGQPGVAGEDDDGDDPGDGSRTDEPDEIGWQDSDDYEPVMEGLPPADAPAVAPHLTPESPTIVDLLKYRVQYERRKRGLQNYNDAQLSAIVQQMLAPELIAGQRMDLNRPFGDGRDSGDGFSNDDDNGDGNIDDKDEIDEPDERFAAMPDRYMNGVVDDPLEAGEPFVDVNGNGRRDVGEYFYNIIGGTGEYINDDAQYDGPIDHLWAGLTGEPIAFDYNNGGAVDFQQGSIFTEGRRFDLNSSGKHDAGDGRLRDNGVLQRQVFARHLYCLMMLLIDESYITAEIARLDNYKKRDNNIEFLDARGRTNLENLRAEHEQLAFRMAQERNGGADPTADQIKAEKREAYVRLLRKRTARRVAQWAINCVDYRDADAIMTPFEYDDNPFDGWGLYDRNDNFIPLDGDVATNENWGEDLPYPKKFDPDKPVGPDNQMNDPYVVNATRDVVWGVERPELLITETLAFHDRRCTDDGTVSPGINDTPSPPTPPDFDLDQRLKPRGSLFVELYNPWSPDGQKPTEFYGTPNGVMAPQGVMLNRLSTVGVQNAATGQTRYSPVWRMAVVRNPEGNPSQAVEAPFLAFDPDGFGFDSNQDSERLVYFTTGGDTNRSDDGELENVGGQLGEYDFTPLPQPPIPVMNQLRVWVPPIPYREDHISGAPSQVSTPTAKRYFIARTERHDGPPFNDTDVPIAPILPGRYAVVGSSGLQLNSSVPGAPPYSTPEGMVTERFVTPTSRFPGQPDDRTHLNQMDETRRIELWPSTNPDAHQLLIAENAGPEFIRFDGNSPLNVHDPDLDGNPTNTPFANMLIDPCVVIPVEDLNVSEPVEGYPSHLYQELFYEKNGVSVNIAKILLNDVGDLEFDLPYDHPLDLEKDLIRNATKQNYRTIHLQRLANPMLPWNPPPLNEKGEVNQLYQPHLPVNPYLTIDSQSVDLTAFNGASELESQLPTSKAWDDSELSRHLTDRDLTQSVSSVPLSPTEFKFAPDDVVLAFIHLLIDERILPQSAVPYDPDAAVQWFRELSETGPEQVEGYFSQLEQRWRVDGPDQTDRQKLISNSRRDSQMPPRDWGGLWGTSLYRRILPEDPSTDLPHPPGTFRQRLHFKSLERGGHDTTLSSDGSWWFDAQWEPRLLWKQERPNHELPFGSNRITDLETVLSRRQILGNYNPGETTQPPDERNRNSQIVNNNPTLQLPDLAFNFMLDQTLGFTNEAYAPELDRPGNIDATAMMGRTTPKRGAPEIAVAGSAREPVMATSLDAEEVNATPKIPSYIQSPGADVVALRNEITEHRRRLLASTFPWLGWNNRPFVSEGELMQVPASASSMMLRDYSVINQSTTNPYDSGQSVDIAPPDTLPSDDVHKDLIRQRGEHQMGLFGHLLNLFQTAAVPATSPQLNDPTAPLDATKPLEFVFGAPNYYRILDYIEVPSRYVGTDDLLTAEYFHDVPGLMDGVDPNTVGTDITDPLDPRINFQPPFNNVSRQRDPGRVNLNTVVGRRLVDSSGVPRIWSEVYDGIMHRSQVYDPGPSPPTTEQLIAGDGHTVDSNGSLLQLSHFGPAWRDVVLSRKGYAQFNADDPGFDFPVEKPADGAPPDVFAFGLNRGFPTLFANPFRSPDAGDLVPLRQMQQHGVDASWLRVHPRTRGEDRGWGIGAVGAPGADDNADGLPNDLREAGFGDDEVSHRGGPNDFPNDYRAIPEEEFGDRDREGFPLFSETTTAAAIDATRNPAMIYQPMTRLGNLVTTRSNVFAIWVTVGYFEVEPAPNWNDSNSAIKEAVRERFGGTTDDDDPETIYGRALYDRVYPEGYMLGQEVGSDTGNTKRQRAFYIIDRTEPVGFKPGEDLNVERAIRVRRRVE